MAKRVFLIVLDSFGIGAEPDAEQFGDAGTNTLAAVAADPAFCGRTLAALGLFNIQGGQVRCTVRFPLGELCPPAGGQRRQGYHHRPLGDCGAGERRAAAHVPPGISAGTAGPFHRGNRVPGALQPALLGHQCDTGLRHGASAHRCPDCLHLGGQRVSDCRQRGHRAGGNPLPGLRAGAETADREVRRRARDRPPLCGRQPGDVHPHLPPP